MSEILSDNVDIFALIKEGEFGRAKALINTDPSILNSVESQYGSTPLISAEAIMYKVYHGSSLPPSGEQLEPMAKYREFITWAIQEHGQHIDVLACDNRGNTLGHRPAFYGDSELCAEVIKLAAGKGAGIFQDLVRMQNTAEETIFDNAWPTDESNKNAIEHTAWASLKLIRIAAKESLAIRGAMNLPSSGIPEIRNDLVEVLTPGINAIVDECNDVIFSLGGKIDGPGMFKKDKTDVALVRFLKDGLLDIQKNTANILGFDEKFETKKKSLPDGGDTRIKKLFERVEALKQVKRFTSGQQTLQDIEQQENLAETSSAAPSMTSSASLGGSSS